MKARCVPQPGVRRRDDRGVDPGRERDAARYSAKMRTRGAGPRGRRLARQGWRVQRVAAEGLRARIGRGARCGDEPGALVRTSSCGAGRRDGVAWGGTGGWSGARGTSCNASGGSPPRRRPKRRSPACGARDGVGSRASRDGWGNSVRRWAWGGVGRPGTAGWRRVGAGRVAAVMGRRYSGGVRHGGLERCRGTSCDASGAGAQRPSRDAAHAPSEASGRLVRGRPGAHHERALCGRPGTAVATCYGGAWGAPGRVQDAWDGLTRHGIRTGGRGSRWLLWASRDGDWTPRPAASRDGVRYERQQRRSEPSRPPAAARAGGAEW